jgi:hypothetical protein
MSGERARPRFVVFIDRADAEERFRQMLGPGAVELVSRLPLGPSVRRVTRANRPQLFAELRRLHLEAPFTGVIYWQEHYVIVATELTRHLGLPVMVEDPLVVRDKLRMKRALAPSVACAEVTLLPGGLAPGPGVRVAFPCVLKPRYAFASICAMRIDGREELERELPEKRDKLLTTRIFDVDVAVPPDPDFLCESFVGGTEHTVESFVVGGVAALQIISDKLPMVPPYFVETGDVMPSRLTGRDRDEVLAAARAAIRAVGIRAGWTHVEIKLENGVPFVMEAAARMGGGYTRDLVREVYGIDMLRALVDGHLGAPAPAPPEPRKAVVARRLICPGVSLVVGVGGLDEAKRRPDFRLVTSESMPRPRGLVLGMPYSYGGTLLSYFVSGGSPSDALEKSEDVARRLEVRSIGIRRLPAAWYRAYLRVKRAAGEVAEGGCS